MVQVDEALERPVEEMKLHQAEDVLLETARKRFSNVFKRHGELTERLSRDSDKTIFERLQKEFEAVRVAQTQEVHLHGEEWNDGLLATIREQVHLEAERKATQAQGDSSAVPNLPHEKITYKAGNKIICCLDGSRIGILYEIPFAGEPCEVFHCVLESKSFLEKMTVVEHTAPFCLPIREAENDYLSTNAMKFINYVGDLLQGYVDRKEQIRLLKELYGNQIMEFYCSLQNHLVEFVHSDRDRKVVVSLRYDDLTSTLPSRVCVLAWPVHQSKKLKVDTTLDNKENNGGGKQVVPSRLAQPESAFRTMSLPEAFAEMVLNMSQTLQETFPELNGSQTTGDHKL